MACTTTQRQQQLSRFRRPRFEAWGEIVDITEPTRPAQPKPFPKLMPAEVSGCHHQRHYNPEPPAPQPVHYPRPKAKAPSYATRQQRQTAWPMRCGGGDQLAGRRYHQRVLTRTQFVMTVRDGLVQRFSQVVSWLPWGLQ